MTNACSLRQQFYHWGTLYEQNSFFSASPKVYSIFTVYGMYFRISQHSGDYYGEGEVRKKELLHSAAILGISGTHVEIVNDS